MLQGRSVRMCTCCRDQHSCAHDGIVGSDRSRSRDPLGGHVGVDVECQSSILGRHDSHTSNRSRACPERISLIPSCSRPDAPEKAHLCPCTRNGARFGCSCLTVAPRPSSEPDCKLHYLHSVERTPIAQNRSFSKLSHRWRLSLCCPQSYFCVCLLVIFLMIACLPSTLAGIIAGSVVLRPSGELEMKASWTDSPKTGAM